MFTAITITPWDGTSACRLDYAWLELREALKFWAEVTAMAAGAGFQGRRMAL